MARSLQCFAAVLLISCSSMLQAATVDIPPSTWTQYRQTNAHTACDAAQLGPGAPGMRFACEAWNLTTGDAITASPVVYGGVVFIGSADKNFYAVNLYTGDIVWQLPMPAAITETAGVSAATGTVLVIPENNVLYAINVVSGTINWQYTFKTVPSYSSFCAPVLSSDGLTVYASVAPGYVYAIDISSGNVLWNVYTGDTVIFPVTLHEDAGLLYFTENSYMRAVNISTGAYAWQAYLSERTTTTLTLDRNNNIIYAPLWSRSLLALNALNGSLLLNVSLDGGYPTAVALSANSSEIAVGLDVNGNGFVVKMAATTGEVLWNFSCGDSISRSAPIFDAAGDVYFGDLGFYLFRLNGTTGERIWFFQTQDEIHASPVLAAIPDPANVSASMAVVLIGSDDGRLYAVGKCPSYTTFQHQAPKTSTSKPAVTPTLLWPSARHDFDNSGRSTTTGPKGPLVSPKWNVSLNGGGANPCVTLGSAESQMMYYGLWNGVLVAGNVTTGAVIWTFNTSKTIEVAPLLSANETVLYFGSQNGVFYALHAATGALKWQFATGAEIYDFNAILSPDGSLVFFASWNEYLYSVDAETGEVAWKYYTDTLPGGTPAIGADGTLFVQLMEEIVSLEPGTGFRLWRFSCHIGGWQISTALDGDGNVVAVCINQLSLVNASNGKAIWTQAHPVTSELSTPPAISSDGTWYIGRYEGTYAGSLLAVRGSDGKALWSFDTHAQVWSPPAIGADGIIYFGTDNNTVFALSPEGACLWTYNLTNKVPFTPVPAPDGTLIIASAGRNLVALADVGESNV